MNYNEHMLIALLTGILLVLLAFAAAFAVVAFKILGLYRSFRAFVSPKAEGQTSELADAVQAASEVVARTVVMQAKATFMGMQSGAARAAAAVEGDIAEDTLAASSPLAGALLNSFPTLRRTLRRNPGLLDVALPFLGKLKAGGGGGGNGAAPPIAVQPRFKL